ncbi:redoxin domain-containing protein [Aquimarina rhabdastrellae]
MKKIALLGLALLALACQEKETKQGYQISGKAIGFEDGQTIYVNSLSSSNRPIIIDSAVVSNNSFSASLPLVEQKDFHYLTFKNAGGNVVYVAENTPIQMTIYKDSLRSSIINGGKGNKLFFDYNQKKNQIAQDLQKLNNDYIIASRLKETEKLPGIREKQAALKIEQKDFRIQLAKENPSELMAIIALADVMNLKLAPAKEANTVYTNLDPSVKNSRLGKLLANTISQSIGAIDIGSVASDFSAPTPEGTPLSLKQAMGEITIIDFWASWCKPCRIENPNVVKLYNEYHDKGLNIIGVSLDKNKAHWVKAIEDDQLSWNHISNLRYWQEPIAKAYGVRSIPATFILDKDGKVIAKNLRGAQLDAKIAELLGDSSTL